MSMRDARSHPALERVLAIARDDARVLAVIVSGSLADPEATPDAFQDVDVVLVTDDAHALAADAAFLERFGVAAIVQRPDEMLAATPRHDGGVSVLMLFVDDTRVDLTLLPSAAMDGFEHDGPSLVPFDPDDLVPPVPPDAASRFAPRRPSARAFAECCNEFWWVAPYVAKGLRRAQVTYAAHHLDVVLRRELLRLLDWHVGEASAWRRGGGTHGRDLERRLEPELWRRLLATYADADPAHVWRALEAMTALFHDVASSLARRLELAYPNEDAERVRAHLERMAPRRTDA